MNVSETTGWSPRYDFDYSWIGFFALLVLCRQEKQYHY